MADIIRVTGLTKSYGDLVAVDDVSFSVAENALFAFLGPNGAGKSTVINMICTLLEPDGGEIVVDGLVLGEDDAGIRGNLGVVFQESVLDPLLTVRENLMTRGSLYGLRDEELEERVAWAAAAAGTDEYVDRRYGKLSGGQKRRADIARALISKPRLLMLDEPTTGLDPQTRKNIWNAILRLREEEGVTVFLTTHYMEEAEGADHVVIIDHGRIAAEGTPSELKEKYASDVLVLSSANSGALTDRLTRDGVAHEFRGDRVRIRLGCTKDAIALLNRYEDLIDTLEVKMGTMDDAFIGITGDAIR
ncbi:MAG: ABC transporter ATP-binding protein [Thermoplasmatales archaeon]|nr:ABC transporter ATP-binding protein [Thermoplasmatales archaeon]